MTNSAIPFNSQQWQSGDFAVRKRMANHPSFALQLLDKTEDQVVELLGSPAGRRTMEDDVLLLYRVDKGFLVDYWLVKIHIEDGRVVSVGLAD